MNFLSRKQRPPSWFEVILGALLSVALGVALGAAYLATRPVKTVGEAPKDAAPTAVFFVEGVKGYVSTASVQAKKKAFLNGDSVTVDEAELNVLFSGPTKPPPPPAPKNTLAQPPPPPPAKEYDVAPINVRIHDGKIQFAEVYTLNDYGLNGNLVVQARGDIVKSGDGFEFVPDVFYVGCCPLQRIPYVRSWLLKKILFVQPFPADLAAAWSKLTDVSIEGSKLRLKMP
jgi:hypothetical protein